MKRGQSLRPAELLILVGILFFTSLLLFIYSSVENATHERSIEILQSSVGGGRILSDLMNSPISDRTLGDDILRAREGVETSVRQYMQTYEPQIRNYKIIRNNQIIAQSENSFEDGARIRMTLNRIEITMEYKK